MPQVLGQQCAIPEALPSVLGVPNTLRERAGGSRKRLGVALGASKSALGALQDVPKALPGRLWRVPGTSQTILQHPGDVAQSPKAFRHTPERPEDVK